MAVINRTDYDQICTRKLMNDLCIEDFHEAQQMQDCNYPKSTKAVIEEL